MRPPARERATRSNGRECLALREQAACKEGDAFLPKTRIREAVLLMQGGPYGVCVLRNAPPLQMAPQNDARFTKGDPVRRDEAFR